MTDNFKKYEYRVLQQEVGELDIDFLKRVNKSGEEGFRYLYESLTDSGIGRVLMEKEGSTIEYYMQNQRGDINPLAKLRDVDL